MWKKQNEIKGVTASSIVDLKAILYQTEQERKQGITTTKVVPKGPPLLKQNVGISSRQERDQKQFDSETPEAKLQESRLKLEEKAKLYEKLKRGRNLEDENKYSSEVLVDFDTKYYSSDSRHEDESRDKRSKWEKEEILLQKQSTESRDLRHQSLSAVLRESVDEKAMREAKKREREAEQEAKRRKILEKLGAGKSSSSAGVAATPAAAMSQGDDTRSAPEESAHSLTPSAPSDAATHE